MFGENVAKMSCGFRAITENEFRRSLVTFWLYPTVISHFFRAALMVADGQRAGEGHTDGQGQSYGRVINLLIAILHRHPSLKWLQWLLSVFECNETTYRKNTKRITRRITMEYFTAKISVSLCLKGKGSGGSSGENPSQFAKCQGQRLWITDI